tara:strand:- start:172 stop:651 length:480 start_codon:yes stop_codon:yes gene_type:complete
MNKKIVYKVEERKRTHPSDPRIDIEETVLSLVKTVGFNFVGEKQEDIGYIWSNFTMVHHQTYRGRSLDSWASKDEELKDYEERCEDFKKLMKNIDVPDDDIKGPYDRDEQGKKLIGDVIEHWHCEEEMGRIEFNRLCRNAEKINCLIEIQYEKGEIDVN